MQVQQELERFTLDAKYFDDHRQDLQERYPERWVAIYRQEVVGDAKDLKRLVAQLERRGIPRGAAFVDYATEQEDLLIL